MIIRELKESDVAALREIHEKQGFDYEFPNLKSDSFELVYVAVDETDTPVAMVAFEKILQTYLICGEMRPITKKIMIRQFHEVLAPLVRKRGYLEINAFLPPPIEKSFSRRLMRTFGWVRNWNSYAKAVS